MRVSMPDITDLLNRWHQGDRDAFDELMPRVYGEMRAMAAGLLRGERPGQLLDTGRQLFDVSLVFAMIISILVVGVAVDRIVFSPLERGVLRRRGLLVD